MCKWIYFTHRHRVISSHALSSLWVWRFIVCKFIPLTATQFVILTCEMILKQVVSAACVHFTGCLLLWSHSLKIMLSFSLKIRKALTMRVISQQFVGSCFTTGVFGSSKAILCLVVALHSRLNANVSPGCQVLCWPPWCGLCLSRSDTWRILETWVSCRECKQLTFEHSAGNVCHRDTQIQSEAKAVGTLRTVILQQLPSYGSMSVRLVK